MRASRPILGGIALGVVAFLAGLASGCGTSAPVAPSKSMQYEKHLVNVPPSGQALVCVHRPRSEQGHTVYTRIWRGTNLIADLGNGQSLARVCPPGRQYFINRSTEGASVVEADLLPNQTYDLWIDTAGTTLPSFQLKPVRSGVAERAQVMEWSEENIWVAPRAALHAEPESVALTKEILHEFVEGSNQERLGRLGPQDHR